MTAIHLAAKYDSASLSLILDFIKNNSGVLEISSLIEKRNTKMEMTPLHVAADNSSSLPTKYVLLQNHSEIFFLLTSGASKCQIFIKFQMPY
jgi:hypothetical protein